MKTENVTNKNRNGLAKSFPLQIIGPRYNCDYQQQQSCWNLLMFTSERNVSRCRNSAKHHVHRECSGLFLLL